MQCKKVLALIKKEGMVEWRQKFAIGGVLLYLVSTVFVSYLAFDGIIPLQTWNALFWLIMLFAATNAILKSFIQEHDSRRLYYYTIASAREVIVAKIAYNALLLFVVGAIGVLVFFLFMGNPLDVAWVFAASVALGMPGLAAALTLVSAIASRARNSFTLMAVLGFPLALPLLLLLVRLSGAGISGAPNPAIFADLAALVLLIVVTVALSLLLFPYIWKE